MVYRSNQTTGFKQHTPTVNPVTDKSSMNKPIQEGSLEPLTAPSPATVKELLPEIQAAVLPTVRELEKKYLDLGLANVSKLDPSIKLDMRYAADSNFFGRAFYPNFNKCYLQEEPAKMLSKAQEFLKEKYPRYSLKVLDCARPRRVQKAMWETVKGTEYERFVVSPYTGAMQNYGAAVDITIVDDEGTELDMGTAFGDTSQLSMPIHNKRFSRTGELAPKQLANRVLLSKVMKQAGFKPIREEWWHFVAFNKDIVREKYRIIE